MSYYYNMQYRDTLAKIMRNGVDVQDRTGVGTREIFDVNLSAKITQLSENEFTLPLLTLRQVYPRSMWSELFWMLRGSTDARELQERNIKIWDEHSSREFLDSRGLHNIREGFIGDGYGKQFRNFNGVDQLKELLIGLVENPNSRRHIISLWNPGELRTTALPWCHVMYNFMVDGERLHLKFFQRSNDFMLAGNANMVFACFFLTWVAKKTGFTPGKVAHSITNCHLYHNHFEVVFDLIERTPLETEASYIFPDSGVRFEDRQDIEDFLDDELNTMWELSTWDKIQSSLQYKSHPRIDPKRLIIAV